MLCWFVLGLGIGYSCLRFGFVVSGCLIGGLDAAGVVVCGLDCLLLSFEIGCLYGGLIWCCWCCWVWLVYLCLGVVDLCVLFCCLFLLCIVGWVFSVMLGCFGFGY